MAAWKETPPGIGCARSPARFFLETSSFHPGEARTGETVDVYREDLNAVPRAIIRGRRELERRVDIR